MIRNSLLILIACYITLIPMQVSALTAKVIAESVNIRSGPGVNYSIISTAKKGDRFDLIEVKENWSKVKLLNGEGWIYSKLINVKPPQQNSPTKKGIEDIKINVDFTCKEIICNQFKSNFLTKLREKRNVHITNIDFDYKIGVILIEDVSRAGSILGYTASFIVEIVKKRPDFFLVGLEIGSLLLMLDDRIDQYDLVSGPMGGINWISIQTKTKDLDFRIKLMISTLESLDKSLDKMVKAQSSRYIILTHVLMTDTNHAALADRIISKIDVDILEEERRIREEFQKDLDRIQKKE